MMSSLFALIWGPFSLIISVLIAEFDPILIKVDDLKLWRKLDKERIDVWKKDKKFKKICKTIYCWLPHKKSGSPIENDLAKMIVHSTYVYQIR